MVEPYHTRIRLHVWLLAWSVAAWLCFMSGRAHAGPIILVPEARVHLVRDTSTFDVTAPVVLVPGDLLATDAGAASAQIEDGSGTLVAIGPHTQVAVGAPAPGGAGGQLWALSLLSGWLKVARSTNAERLPLAIDTPNLHVDLGQGSVVMRASRTATSVYVEAGSALVAAPDTRAAPQTLKADQYAGRNAGQGIISLARMPTAFVAELPVTFRDPLGPAPLRAPVQAVAGPSHDVVYADIGDWLVSHLPMRQSFVARFASLAEGRAFRALIKRNLRDLPDWRRVIFPPPPEVKPQPSAAMPNAAISNAAILNPAPRKNGSASPVPPIPTIPSFPPVPPLPITTPEDGS